MSSLGTKLHSFFSARGNEEGSDSFDDIDDSTATLLSMLPTAPIVVDNTNEVVRSNPEAYRLGLVRNDAVIEPKVLEAIERVRISGGKYHLDVTTETPQEFLNESTAETNRREISDRSASTTHSEVSRPNWIHVTVGRISDAFVVVLVDDVSESIRFSQTRDAFIENVSEQLTKPIQALQHLALRLESGQEPQELIANDAKLLRQYCLHLEHTIADLMLLIKAQEKVVPNDTNRIKLLNLVQGVVTSLQPSAQQAAIHLNIGGDPKVAVNADAQQITAAIHKLIENAIAYSPQGAAVNVAVETTVDGTHAVVRVIDQGNGIVKAERERIFERFYRGSNQNERTSDGVGLGLAIVKHVALTHHGSVTVWSAPRQGSTFSLILPLANA
ncbi:sensor histidine kinase [Bifidobacterium sp.]|jgi:signal transduction histidine kinase|uniref:sensor histidine kinase n=1 Tax=Bifidobacterium sp. TaxID=41200 RepID=UPI0025BD8BEF|nr:HAMP domain-containing sensor histidine kinase [Bifidobacterium sp.]MCI1635359.1 HAMP domain-containing histidine kinase [Bifidobacterium sp.]